MLFRSDLADSVSLNTKTQYTFSLCCCKVVVAYGCRSPSLIALVNLLLANNCRLWTFSPFNAYVKDEKGNFLGIAEVRERLINNQPLVLNEDANHNNDTKQTKEEY